MVQCKQCGIDIKVVKSKVQKQFCTDAHRKAFKRAELKKSEATATPSVDELRTTGTKLPTSDNLGQLTSDKALPEVAVLQEDYEITAHSKQVFPKTTRFPTHKRGKDIKCFAAAAFEPLIERTIKILKKRGIVVGKPGDADYNGICTPEWRAERGR